MNRWINALLALMVWIPVQIDNESGQIVRLDGEFISEQKCAKVLKRYKAKGVNYTGGTKGEKYKCFKVPAAFPANF
tara:strand:+ start:652 stop:879 length:228 start_codon:yes stop_codon:yes gene_type:complete